MSPRSSLKQVANVRRSSSGVGEIPIRFCPDSVTLDRQTTRDNEETVVEAPADEEAYYSCTETLVGSSNESTVTAANGPAVAARSHLVTLMKVGLSVTI